MSANRSNIIWHLRNLIGGGGNDGDVPAYGTKGYAPGAVAIKATGTVGLGIYINYGTKDSCDFRTEAGMTPVLAGESEQDIHKLSATQVYAIGSRLTDSFYGGRRTFYYSKAINTLEPGRGVHLQGNITDDGVSSNVDTAQVVGDTTLHYASQTFTVNELRGGSVVVYSAGSTYQQRRVIANTVCSGSAMTVTVDRPWSTVITNTQFTEILPNPYRYIKRAVASTSHKSFAGVPMASATAALPYFWLQTYGPLWCNPQSGVGGGTAERMVIFGPDGSLRNWDFNRSQNTGYQMAGYIIQADTLNNDGPPFIQLMCAS